MFAVYKRMGTVEAMRVDAVEDRGVEGSTVFSGSYDSKGDFVATGSVSLPVSVKCPGVGSFVVRDGLGPDFVLSADEFAKTYAEVTAKKSAH